MDKTELLTTASVLELFNVRGLYSVGYSLLFGSCEQIGLDLDMC
jgi:hypothetical protein